jgi:hypothetical protein
MCNRQLRRASGKRLGLFHFEIVTDPFGMEHRVHKSPCLKEAKRDGNRHVEIGDETKVRNSR